MEQKGSTKDMGIWESAFQALGLKVPITEVGGAEELGRINERLKELKSLCDLGRGGETGELVGDKPCKVLERSLVLRRDF